jgi:hypothetical protein
MGRGNHIPGGLSDAHNSGVEVRRRQEEGNPPPPFPDSYCSIVGVQLLNTIHLYRDIKKVTSKFEMMTYEWEKMLKNEKSKHKNKQKKRTL